MVGRFSAGLLTIVTRRAILGDAAVIELRDGPLLGGMAGLARGHRLDMVGRLAFGANAVVAV